MRLTIRLTFLAAMIASASAQAGTYAFSYQTSQGLLEGQLRGTLQADHNTIVIAKIFDNVTFNGVHGPSLPYLTTGSSLFFDPTPPTVTIDGSHLEFALCATEFCTGQTLAEQEGILFDPFVVAFQPIFVLSPAYGNINFIDQDGNVATADDLDPAHWSLIAVPEPSSWAMMIAGFGILGANTRRYSRRRASALL